MIAIPPTDVCSSLCITTPETAGIQFIPENGGGAGVRLAVPGGRRRVAGMRSVLAAVLALTAGAAEAAPCGVLVKGKRAGDQPGEYRPFQKQGDSFPLKLVGGTVLVDNPDVDELWLWDVGYLRLIDFKATPPDLVISVRSGWRGTLPPAAEAQAERCQSRPVS